MRLLFVVKYLPDRMEGQKSDLINSILDGQRSLDHEVEIVSLNPPKDGGRSLTERLKRKCRSTLYAILGKLFPNRADRLLFRPATRRVLRLHSERPFDVIYAISTDYHTAIFAEKASIQTGVPYIIHEHKIYERLYKDLSDIGPSYLSALRNASKVLAVSPPLANTMIDLGVRNDIEVVPNPISDGFFEKPQGVYAFDKDFFSWSGGRFVFGAWTRWRHFKRIDILLDAFKMLSESNDEALLFIGGPIEDGFDDISLQEWIAENGLDVRIWIYGETDRDHIHRFAHYVDSVVVPSDFETFALPALEGQAAGKPVVATRCGGPESIVTSDALGRVVVKDDAEALADAMMEVMRNREGFDSEEIVRSAA